MISDLNGSLGSPQFLNIANERTCSASCACGCAFQSSGLPIYLFINFQLVDTQFPSVIRLERDQNRKEK